MSKSAETIREKWRRRAERIGPAGAGKVPPCIYGDRFSEGCCDGWKVRCHHPSQPEALVVKPKHCAHCERRLPPGRLRIGAVITARNEGDEVHETVKSLADSVIDAQLMVALVDDGSTDGSCDAERFSDVDADHVVITRIRHEESEGVGRSRNAGWATARGLGCDVVTFHDAHMRFNPGDLEALAVKALRTGALVTGASHDVPSKGRLRGCWMHYSAGYGIQPKWATAGQVRDYVPEGLREGKPKPDRPDSAPLPEWWRTPCMMGACYVVPVETGKKLEAATGQLWDDTAGVWGFSEQALSIKAWLLDVPILQSRDYAAGHNYRGHNPHPDANAGQWRNIARCTALYFGREVFDRRFRTWCEGNLPAGELEEIVAGALADAPEPGCWLHHPHDAFTHLLGIGAPITGLHPEHKWLLVVQEVCRELAAEHPEGEGVRVLQWRPGEATLLCRYLLPKAEIIALEVAGYRVKVWTAACKAHGVALHQLEVADEDYCTRPVHASWRGEGFDLVLIGGERQGECLAVAGRLLRPGDGRIVRNPMADRLQIEDDELKKERKALRDLGFLPNNGGDHEEHEEHEEGNDANDGQAEPSEVRSGQSPGAALGGTSARPASAPSKAEGRRQKAEGNGNGGKPDPLVTVCVLNWARDGNIGELLTSIRAQTVPAKVVLWNNGDPIVFRDRGGTEKEGAVAHQALRPIAEHPLVSLAVQSSRNVGCFPRWWLASLADTEYVCSMDDDLAFADERVLADAVAYAQRHCRRGIIGLFGWRRVEDKDYRHGEHIQKPPGHEWVDVIKGRFMFFRRELLDRVPLALPGLPVMGGIRQREDDIILSLCIGAGREHPHLVMGPGKRWRDLPTRGVSSEGTPGHWQHRQDTLEYVTHWLEERR